MNSYRDEVIYNFALWTAVAALRSGKHIKDTRTITSALKQTVNLNAIPRTQIEFDKWHKEITLQFKFTVTNLYNSNRPKIKNENFVSNNKNSELEFSIGWASKALNVFLKSLFYINDSENLEIKKFLHPPIDNILVREIKRKYHINLWQKEESNFSISRITSYEKYEGTISVIKTLANEQHMTNLLDIEHIWRV